MKKNRYTLASKIKPTTSVAENPVQPSRDKRLGSTLVKNNIIRTKSDIGNWVTAHNASKRQISPQNYHLFRIYDEILIDNMLASQIQNRKLSAIGSEFCIKQNNTINQELTLQLQQSKLFRDILSHAWDSILYGASLMQVIYENKEHRVELIQREHVIHQSGLLVPFVGNSDGIHYREIPEFKHTVIECYYQHFGILDAAVPIALIKKFAFSSWSEFCEIFGMPHRIAKTDTMDYTLVSRMQTMLQQMGRAPYSIIDLTEDMIITQPTTSNGETYEKIITLCNNELSMLIAGAIIGQDTKNGNRSKEEMSIKLLDKIIDSDKQLLSSFINEQALDCLASLGIIPQGATFEFIKTKDIEQLWSITQQALPFYDIPAEWIEQTFGIKALPKQQPKSLPNTQLSADFFV